MIGFHQKKKRVVCQVSVVWPVPSWWGGGSSQELFALTDNQVWGRELGEAACRELCLHEHQTDSVSRWNSAVARACLWICSLWFGVEANASWCYLGRWGCGCCAQPSLQDSSCVPRCFRGQYIWLAEYQYYRSEIFALLFDTMSALEPYLRNKFST